MANIPGLSGDTVANSGLALKWLDILSGTTYTGLGTTYVQLHNGQPGFTGLANPSLCYTVGSANTARKTLAWTGATNSPSTNVATKAISGTPSWTGWDWASRAW